MRSNVECRRCGCGSIIGLRESCPKCVAAQRARLHAQRVGNTETYAWCSASYDNGQSADRYTVRGYDEVAMFDAGKYEAMIAACDKRIARLVYVGTPSPKPLPPTPVPVGGLSHLAAGFPPAIGEVVSWDIAKADMQARPEARYRERYRERDKSDVYAGQYATRFIGGECWHGDPGEGWPCANSELSRERLVWAREA